jgi:hypothetical protein
VGIGRHGHGESRGQQAGGEQHIGGLDHVRTPSFQTRSKLAVPR